jgi:hypothetical protein
MLLLGLVLLGPLAARFGVDSRDQLPSEEERLARFGVTWQLHET